MSADILGTSWDQCRSMVQYSFTSTETRRLVRTDSPGRPPRLSYSSWTMKASEVGHKQFIVCAHRDHLEPNWSQLLRKVMHVLWWTLHLREVVDFVSFFLLFFLFFPLFSFRYYLVFFLSSSSSFLLLVFSLSFLSSFLFFLSFYCFFHQWSSSAHSNKKSSGFARAENAAKSNLIT